MSIILGLMILCLGVYFLGLFFQVARLEKIMTESVSSLEKFMILKYALGDDKKKASGGEGDEAKAGDAPPAALKT